MQCFNIAFSSPLAADEASTLTWWVLVHSELHMLSVYCPVLSATYLNHQGLNAS